MNDNKPNLHVLPLFRRFLRGALIAVMAWAVVACDEGNQRNVPSPQPDRVADEAEIRARIAVNRAAANRLDAAGVAATFTADADLIAFSGPKISGRAEIQRAIEIGKCNDW